MERERCNCACKTPEGHCNPATQRIDCLPVPPMKGGTIVARTRFIQAAGVGLLLAAAIQTFLMSRIYVWMAIPLDNLKPLQAIIPAAVIIGLVALIVAQENHLGWLGYLGFGIALAGELSVLIGSLTNAASDGFAWLLFFIDVLVLRDPQRNSFADLSHIGFYGSWLTLLCLCVGLSLYGLASLRARRIPLWGAGALLALGLLRLPAMLLLAPFAPSRYSFFPEPVYNALLISRWPIGPMSVLLWSILGVALLVQHTRTS